MNRFALLVLLLALPVLAADNVADPLPGSAEPILRNAQGGIGRTATWVVAVDSGAAVDAWATAPAELRTAIDARSVRSQVRYVIAEHCDVTDAAVPACVRMGPAADSPALSCTAGSQNGKPLNAEGRFFLLQIRPIATASSISGSSVPIWLRGSSATAVDICLTAGW